MRRAPLLIAAALAALPLAALAGARTETVTGPALVMDGDTIMVALRKVRLVNLDAPELAQTCTRAGADWPCGRMAAEAMATLIADKDVTCDLTGQHSYGRKLGRCFVGGQDLGAWMVANGWAAVDPRFGDEYRPLQAKARGGRLNIWSGAFQQPCQFRGSC